MLKFMPLPIGTYIEIHREATAEAYAAAIDDNDAQLPASGAAAM